MPLIELPENRISLQGGQNKVEKPDPPKKLQDVNYGSLEHYVISVNKGYRKIKHGKDHYYLHLCTMKFNDIHYLIHIHIPLLGVPLTRKNRDLPPLAACLVRKYCIVTFQNTQSLDILLHFQSIQ